MEIWDKIDDNYEISNYGNLRSIDRQFIRNNKVVNLKSKLIKWNKPHKKREFYVSIALYPKNKEKILNISCHREVAKRFVDNKENKKEVNHKDGNKSNNHYSNLEWVNKEENMNHAVEHNLIKKGQDSSNSKLTNDDIVKIRHEYDGVFGFYSKKAREYNVFPAAIANIIKRKTWKHI